ncbi:hypothetical protein FBY37_5695 [Streptomyces sp. SLBN-134]|nr:hypothetical protein FBY37_5695 [Streptomyces sp. SLBN-134]
MKPRGDGGAADGRMPAQLGSCAGIALCRWVVRGRAGGGRPRTGADHVRCKGCGARTRQPLRAATPAPSPPRRRRPPAAPTPAATPPTTTSTPAHRGQSALPPSPTTRRPRHRQPLRPPQPAPPPSANPGAGSHSTHHSQHPRPPGATRRPSRPVSPHSAPHWQPLRPPSARRTPALRAPRAVAVRPPRAALRTALRGQSHRTPRPSAPHSAGSRAAGAARVGATAPRWRRAAQTHPRPAPTRRTLATPGRVDPHRHGAPRNARPRKPVPRRPQGPARIPSPP